MPRDRVAPADATSSPGMSTFIWGPLVWNLLTDLAVAADQHHADAAFPHSTLSHVWSLLRFILPCKYCRQSYRQFWKEEPPSYPLRRWVWRLRNKVNAKLSLPAWEWSRFERRCWVSSGFFSATQWQDLCFILALNYDPVSKQRPYSRWFQALAILLPHLPHVAVDATPPPRSALHSRFTLLRWLSPRYHFTTEQAVRKYSHAIAHQTIEELSLLCGPLLLQCRTYDGQCSRREQRRSGSQ